MRACVRLFVLAVALVSPHVARASVDVAVDVSLGAAHHDALVETDGTAPGGEAALVAAAILRGRGHVGDAADVLVRGLDTEDDPALQAGLVAALSVLLRESGPGGAPAEPALRRFRDRTAGRSEHDEARSIALLALADLRLRDGDRAGAMSLVTSEAGRIDSWSLIGTYGRFTRLAFDREFPPERGVVEPVQVDGRRPVRRIEAHYEDGRVVVPPSMLRPGSAFAAVDIFVERALSARLRVSSPVAHKVFLNSEVLVVVDRNRESAPASTAARLRLEKGVHRLVLELPADEMDAYASVGLVPDGIAAGAAAGLRFVPARGGPPDGAIAEVSLLPDRLDTDLLANADASPGRALAAWWWLRARGLDERSGRLLELIDASWPEAPLFDLLAGEYWLGARTGASAQKDLSRARTRFEAAREPAPDLVLADVLLARMDDSAQRQAEAWERLRRILDAHPENVAALRLAHDIAARRGWLTEAEVLLDRALAVDPDDADLINDALSLFSRRGAIEALPDLASRLAARQLQQPSLARWLTGAGRTDEAVEEWERLIAARPTSPGPWRDLVRTLMDARRAAAAREALDRAERFHPDAAWIHEARAELAARDADDATVREELARGLAADPGSIALRRALQTLGIADEMSDHLADPQRILAEAGPAPRGVDSSLLADIAAVQIDALGGQTELYQGIHAVYTRAGVEHEGELTVLPGAVIDLIRLHKPDGGFVDVRPGARRPVNLPSLEPGDAIEYVWQRYIPPLAGVPGALDNRTLFIFEAPDREYVLSRFVVAHDETLPVEVCGTFDDLEVSDRIIDGTRLRSYTARGMPRQRLEPHVAHRLEVTSHVRLGLGMTWQEIGDRLRDVLVGHLRPDAPLPALADEARRLAGDATPEALARALHRVVHENVRAGGPSLAVGAPASSFASAGEGNRLGVALALALLLDLDASIVLARPSQLAGLELDCASPGAFGFALLRIELPGGPVYLDYTLGNAPFGLVPNALSGSDALHVPLDPAAPVRVIDLPSFHPGRLRVQQSVLSLDADGRASGTLSISLAGEMAAETRRVFEQVPPDRLPFVHRSIASSVFPGAEVADVDVTGASSTEDPLVFDLGIERGALARRSGTGFAVPLTSQPLGLAQEFASIESRSQPLLFDARLHRRDVTRLLLPSGLEAVAIPEPVDLDGPYGRYRLEVRAEPGALVIEREIDLPYQRVEPGDYAAFRSLVRTIDEAERREIELAVSSPALAR